VSRFILRRLGFMVITVILASILIFWATTILPGDVASQVLGRYATNQAKTELRHKLGLDKPLAVQYVDWLGKYAKGDWGSSPSMATAVRPVVLNRLRNSFMLAIVGFAMYVPLGILLGLMAALRKNTWADNLISIGSLAFIGLPEFVSGFVLIYLFAIRLHIFHASSAILPNSSFAQAFPYLILPGVTVALTSLAYVTRMTRSSTIDVLQMDYVRTANLKGLPSRRVLFTHVLRNSLLPTVTVVAIGIGYLIGGLIITESVYSYPGIGTLLLFAIQRRDLQLVQATALLIVIIYLVANLVADVLYAVLNPRIRYT
jgi:peptide/nickel transport system permease protein